MIDTPRKTAQRFEQLIQREQAGWSEERKRAAERLRLSLHSKDQRSYGDHASLQRGALADLQAFEDLHR